MKLFTGKKVFYILPLILLGLGELFVFFPHFFFIVLTVGSLLIILTTKNLAAKNKKIAWPLFFYFPLIFFLASSLYETLIPNFYIVQLLIFINAYFVFIYFKNLYYFFRYGAPDRIDRLDTFLMAGSVLSVFFLASSIYGLPVFLGWSFWPLLALFSLAVFPLFFQPFILGNLNLKKNYLIFIVALLAFTQLTGVTYLLPFSFNILGLFSTIYFYLLFLIVRLFIRERLSWQLLKFPLFSSLAMIIILLLTARWF
ncbi:MAG: hypothetical protein PWQ35_263 [Patescibacteria group bacterium]|nr:hypothetical protein [Patescibacteria group bacterium]